MSLLKVPGLLVVSYNFGYITLFGPGHWIVVPCNATLGYACVNETNAYQFAVSSSEGPWNTPAVSAQRQ